MATGVMTLEALEIIEAAEPPVRPASALAFAPETFFLGRTEGAGVVRDPLGRIIRRCRVTTEGAYSATQSALRLDEVFTYDDGEVDVWRWAMQAGRDGRYIAAEAKAGTGIAGEQRGGEYVIGFRRPLGRASGLIAPHYRSRFTLLDRDVALKTVRVALFGVPVGSMSAIHRRIR